MVEAQDYILLDIIVDLNSESCSPGHGYQLCIFIIVNIITITMYVNYIIVKFSYPYVELEL